MQPNKNFITFVWNEVFLDIELLYFQWTRFNHQNCHTCSNDEFPLCLMDQFLFLNWNAIFPKHFLIFHVEFLFILSFYLLGHWYYCAHQINLYIFIFLVYCAVVFWGFFFISIFFNWIFINILTTWFFLFLYYFQLSWCLRDFL